MYRQFQHIILALFCLMTTASYGQTNEVVKDLLDSISLTKNSRTLVLMETDTFIVLTTYKLFTFNCEQFIKLFNLDMDKDFLKLFTSDTSKIIYAESLTKTNLNKSRLVFRIADLLVNGQCLVFSKQKKRLEKQIKINRYITQFVAGHLFKTNDNFLILKTEDEIFKIIDNNTFK